MCVIVIGYMSVYFRGTIKDRVKGVVTSLITFYIISNFGVWLSGMYTYDITGLINCYVMAIPFFGNTILSTIIYTSMIEMLLKYIVFSKKMLPLLQKTIVAHNPNSNSVKSPLSNLDRHKSIYSMQSLLEFNRSSRLS